jgi:hypothetical protein
VNNPAVGLSLALVTDTQKGDASVTLSPSDAATLNPGDYIMIFSDEPVDREIQTKHAGEIKQVVGVDANHRCNYC